MTASTPVLVTGGVRIAMIARESFSVTASTERVSVLDASNLRVEEYGLPMHMAALAILDAGTLLDAAGELRLAAIRAHIEEHTRSARGLRQRTPNVRCRLRCPRHP